MNLKFKNMIYYFVTENVFQIYETEWNFGDCCIIKARPTENPTSSYSFDSCVWSSTKFDLVPIFPIHICWISYEVEWET